MNHSNIYPVLNQCTYLNTAYSGLLANDFSKWRSSHDQEFVNLGSEFRLTPSLFIDQVRDNLASLFNSKPEDTFLVPNFSFGLNTLLDGLELHHKFLILSGDYPSVNYPILSRDFECEQIEIGNNLEERIFEKIRICKPTAFAFSLVQYISGIKFTEHFLKAIKREFPDLLLIADCTQFCGTAKFDFEDSAIDVVISSGYKWMLGGYGNGFVFVKDEAKNLLYRNRKTKNLPKEPFLNGKNHLSMCFEPGHLDTISFGTLNHSVNRLRSLDLNFIEQTTQKLTQKAKLEFAKRGLISTDVLERAEHSTILNVSVSPEKVKEFQKEKIICSARGAGTRLSFHYYNTENDLDKLLEVLDR